MLINHDFNACPQRFTCKIVRALHTCASTDKTRYNLVGFWVKSNQAIASDGNVALYVQLEEGAPEEWWPRAYAGKIATAYNKSDEQGKITIPWAPDPLITDPMQRKAHSEQVLAYNKDLDVYTGDPGPKVVATRVPCFDRIADPALKNERHKYPVPAFRAEVLEKIAKVAKILDATVLMSPGEFLFDPVLVRFVKHSKATTIALMVAMPGRFDEWRPKLAAEPEEDTEVDLQKRQDAVWGGGTGTM